MKFFFLKTILFILIPSTILFVMAVFYAFVLVDNHSVGNNFETYFGVKKMKITIIVSIIHFIWWFFFLFFIKKRQVNGINKNN